jgi:hypothetical protein
MEITNAAYAVYPDNVPVAEIVHRLNNAGFPNEDICLMLARNHPISTMVREAGIRGSANQETSDAAVELIAWLSEFGAVVIRTFGFFIRSQVFMQALVTTREAPAFCGNSDSLMGLGFGEKDAARLEDQLSEDGALVYVTCSQGAQAQWVREMLRRMGSKEAAALSLLQVTANAA